MKRENIYINNNLDPDGNRHEFVMYDYGEYQFRKEWYINWENEYVMGLTLFKNGKEIFHSGNVKEETTDNEWIEFVEKLRKVANKLERRRIRDKGVIK